MQGSLLMALANENFGRPRPLHEHEPDWIRILRFLRVEGNRLSSLTSWGLIGVLSFSERLQDLKKRGIKIESEWRETENGKRYKSYRLSPAVDNVDLADLIIEDNPPLKSMQAADFAVETKRSQK